MIRINQLVILLIIIIITGCSETKENSLEKENYLLDNGEKINKIKFSQKNINLINTCLEIDITDDNQLQYACEYACDGTNNEFCEAHSNYKDYCSYLRDGGYSRYACIVDKLKQIDNPLICNYFLQLKKEKCLKNPKAFGTVKGKNPKEICEVIPWTFNSDEGIICLTYYAVKTKDKSYCEDLNEIRVPHRKAMCYTALARTIGDESLCEEITSKYALKDRERCYLQISYDKGDTSLCKKINDRVSREFCERGSIPVKSEYDKYLFK